MRQAGAFPEKPAAMIRRQQGKNPLFGSFLPGFLGLQSFRIIGIGIPGVNLHDIMNKAHDHDFSDIDRFIGILPQQVGHDGHMPGVLGVVFIPSVSGQMGLPEDVLFLIDLQGKCHLLFQTFLHIVPCLFPVIIERLTISHEYTTLSLIIPDERTHGYIRVKTDVKE